MLLNLYLNFLYYTDLVNVVNLSPRISETTLPFVNLDKFIVGFHSKINNIIANSVDPSRAVSSGSALFANLIELVCRDERVKYACWKWQTQSYSVRHDRVAL